MIRWVPLKTGSLTLVNMFVGWQSLSDQNHETARVVGYWETTKRVGQLLKYPHSAHFLWPPRTSHCGRPPTRQ